MSYNPQRALELLRLGTGNPKAEFREQQEDSIRHVVEGKGRLLVVQKTGWGKSFVYFISTKLLREAGAGPVLLISPLLALMRNQIMAATKMGIRALTINSANKGEWEDAEKKINNGETDIVLISPERLSNQRFGENILANIADKVSLLVVDEAHCISDWGHEFRPHYRLIARMARTLPANLRLLATTATANNRVMADLDEILGPNLTVMRGDLNRPSLKLQTIKLASDAEKMAWLAEHLLLIPGHGIIYTLTIPDAGRLAAWLGSQGIEVACYTSESENREELEQALLENKVKALIATVALGMGFDKPDLSFVIHYQCPSSVVAYYQQVGRAGRAIPRAYGILLHSDEDTEITDYFIESAFPSRAEVDQVLNELTTASNGLSINELMASINVSKGRIEKTLLLLSLENPPPIVKEDTKWTLTTTNLSKDFWERAERLTSLRKQEQERMQAYAALTSGHMEFLIRELDGIPGKINTVDLPSLPHKVNPVLVRAAITFLRRTMLPIEPRKQWPPGGLPSYGIAGYKRISNDLQYEPGKALCFWKDAGWGELVYIGKKKDGHYSDELVNACVNLVREWGIAPDWVTCVPSLRHQELVPDFARRLALKLNIPFHDILIKTEGRPEQKLMQNSAQQARNVDGSLGINVKSLPEGDALLVDDMVDSRWTMTVAAWLLRSRGSGKVFPLALSLTGHRND
ncbi:MAG: RecQ family ATP-dependent DNA helicase [Dehalococcoidales bacterium]|nr:RecQ family ATP-dependent DNA helicase [Dehalococcoidales bacterium]